MCEDENKVLRKYTAQKKWKNIPFRFPKQEECTSTDIFKKILGSCKIICSTKYLISSLHIYCYIISDHYRIFTAACTVCTLIVASCNFNCLAPYFHLRPRATIFICPYRSIPFLVAEYIIQYTISVFVLFWLQEPKAYLSTSTSYE